MRKLDWMSFKLPKTPSSISLADPDPEIAERQVAFLQIRPHRLTWLSSATLWAFVGSLVFSSFYARSALLNLTTGVIGGANDGYQNSVE